MKKIILLIMTGILILGGFSTVALNVDNEKLIFEKIENEKNRDGGIQYTHTILGEFGTATWCPYCVYADAALSNLYLGQWHPFYYISMVCDVNTNAYQRAVSELGLTGYPTVYFDGGYTQNVGAGSVESAQAAYNLSIENCAEREVADVDIDLDVTWNGNAEMYIEVYVDNNEESSYSGHIRVYVTELVTSMGWNNNDDIPYKYPFLDYAFNEDISVSAGGVWSDSITWDGHDYDNGYGDDFSSISYGNIMIIGAVFDDNDYVDDVTGYRVGNNAPPDTPSNPDPEDGDTDIILETYLNWSCSDPDYDVLSYDIYFGESTNPPLVASDIVGRSYNPGGLDFDTTYYWKVVAKDTQGGSTTGPVWDFTTRGNDPPNSPSNPNPGNGETDISINKCLSWTCEDPDGDEVTYDVYFGKYGEDLTLVSSNQTSKSFCPEDLLEFETRYDWKIVAWDIYGYSTVGSTWYFITEANLPPNTPSEPDPADGATDVPIDKLLRWTGGDPNQGDKVYYDVYFGTSSDPPLVAEGLLQAAYDPGSMELDTTYYWKIVSKDTQGATTTGPIWQFTTEKEPNQPPTSPDIDGPSKGAAGTELCWTFHSEDPNDNDIKYLIDWGDGNTEETDYYQSCTPVEVCHTYAEDGTYIIKATAEDTKESASSESTFEVIIPRGRFVFQPFLFRFYERLLNTFPIFKILFGH